MKKKLLIALVVVLVVVIGGVVALALSIDSGVKAAVEEGGSHALKVPVSLDDVSVSLTGGKASLKGLTIANPEGFKTPRALHLGEVSIEIKMGSLTSDVIEVPEIVIRQPQVTIEGSTKGSNLNRLIKNLDETLDEYGVGKSEKPEKPEKPEPAGAEMKFNVGRILIEDAKLSLSATFMGGREASATLPKIEIKNLDSEMTMAQLIKRVLSAVVKEAAKRPDQVGKMMGGLAINSGLGAIEGAGKVIKGVGTKGGEVIKGTGKNVKKTIKGIGDIFKKKGEDK